MPRPKEIFESSDKKVCSICKLPKFMDQFTPCKGGKGGKSTDCLQCRREGPAAEKRNAQRREETKRRREMGIIGRRPTHNKTIHADTAVLRNLSVFGTGNKTPTHWDLINR